jgi:hypothetical protein
VFGRPPGGRIDLKRLGRRGFRIDGARAGDRAGLSVAGVGDMNRDGLADVAVSALDADVTGRRDAGAAYVVFGKRGRRPVDLRELGRAGFRIVPGPPRSFVGEVAAAGDVNGDRRPDLVVGAELPVPRGRAAAAARRSAAGPAAPPRRPAATFAAPPRRSGWAWVVFGKRDSRTVDLARLGRRGLLIHGPAERSETKAVAGAGDFNGDRLADIVIGAPRAAAGGRGGAGLAYVVFGRRRGGTIDLTARRARALRLEGAGTRDATGSAVAGGRDVNGDRRPDVIVGASGADTRGRRESGAAYVVLGRRGRGRIALGRLGERGFRVDGERSGDRAGDAVGVSRDMNGDGLGDLLVGASRADANGLRDSGSAYAVFGRAGGSAVDLRELGDTGFRVDGGAQDDSAGIAVSGLGDLDGDRLGDVLIGAFGTTSFGRTGSGAAYLVLGRAR